MEMKVIILREISQVQKTKQTPHIFAHVWKLGQKMTTIIMKTGHEWKRRTMGLESVR
jgi:hypothetical protein